MAINTYRFSYETNVENLSENSNYIDKTVNHIREYGGLPDFNLPSYYRCKATFTRLNPGERIGEFQVSYKIYFLDALQNRKISYTNDVIAGNTLQIYQYNNEIPNSGFPKSDLSERYDELFNKLLSVNVNYSPDPNKEIEYSYVNDYSDDFSENNWSMEWYQNTMLKVDVVLTYSDDDPRAGDEYVEPVEPEKPKKIYLANLDFGYRRSRRNNKNRRKYRKYRNRY